MNMFELTSPFSPLGWGCISSLKSSGQKNERNGDDQNSIKQENIQYNIKCLIKINEKCPTIKNHTHIYFSIDSLLIFLKQFLFRFHQQFVTYDLQTLYNIKRQNLATKRRNIVIRFILQDIFRLFCKHAKLGSYWQKYIQNIKLDTSCTLACGIKQTWFPKIFRGVL